MDITVQKEAIIDGLQKAAGILPTKTGAAYLRSIWLAAEGQFLSIMATDANIEFTGRYPANIMKPGLAGVQGKGFVDLVRQLPNGSLHIFADEAGQTLTLEQGRRRYRLPMSSKEWFQEFSPFPEKDFVSWTGGIFEDYLDKVAFCISDEDMQDSLTCLCIKPIGDGKIDMCGLNGHQFAQVSFIYDDLCAKLPERGLLLQKKFLPDLKKWLGPDEIDLNLTEKRFYLRRLDGAEVLSLPRADYEYPDYAQFLKKLAEEGNSELELPRKEAAESLGRVLVFNTDSDRCVFMAMKPDEVTMSAQGGDLGSARESLEARYKGSLDRIAFPTRNLLDIFGHYNSERLNMRFTGQEGPCGITGLEDAGYTVIIMPMKVASSTYYDDEDE